MGRADRDTAGSRRGPILSGERSVPEGSPLQQRPDEEAGQRRGGLPGQGSCVEGVNVASLGETEEVGLLVSMQSTTRPRCRPQIEGSLPPSPLRQGRSPMCSQEHLGLSFKGFLRTVTKRPLQRSIRHRPRLLLTVVASVPPQGLAWRTCSLRVFRAFPASSKVSQQPCQVPSSPFHRRAI